MGKKRTLKEIRKKLDMEELKKREKVIMQKHPCMRCVWRRGGACMFHRCVKQNGWTIAYFNSFSSGGSIHGSIEK